MVFLLSGFPDEHSDESTLSVRRDCGGYSRHRSDFFHSVVSGITVLAKKTSVVWALKIRATDDRHRLTGYRVSKIQLAGMQQQALFLAGSITGIKYVANDRVSQLLHMNSELM